jgi:hypothetical protein
MSKYYHIIINDNQLGPLSFEELKKNKISKETPIWHEGLSEWTTAKNIPELTSLFNTSTPPPFKSKITYSDNFNVKPRDKSKIFLWIIFFVVLISGIVIYFQDHKNEVKLINQNQKYNSKKIENTNQNNYTEPKTIQKSKVLSEEELKDQLYRKETVYPMENINVSYNWKINLAGNTIVDGHIYNRATLAMYKNVTIKVKFYSKTGTLIGSDTFTVMEFLPPKSKISFKHKINGYWKDITKSDAEIMSAEVHY